MKKRNVAILGSTGSIGTQALDIIRDNPDLLSAYVITGRNNADLLIKQAIEFEPEVVVVANETHYIKVKEALAHLPIKVWSGADAIADAATLEAVDIVLTAMVGYAGLLPTLAAADAGKTIALANKETLVVAGRLVMEKVHTGNASIIPVDSEHSAIFQCLVGEFNPIAKILLTASGGPFLHRPGDTFNSICPADALKHPNWQMGAKVTIDSASLMNKGFEMIEAHWLFGCPVDRIEVLVHPESIVHSMVEFADGSIKAQLGIPDMRLPISYALGLTRRIPNSYPRVDFFGKNLSFFPPDTKRFPNLELAYRAIRQGGNIPCILNAANEVAVEAFLKEDLSFTRMSSLLEYCMTKISYITTPCLEDLIDTDKETRELAYSFLNCLPS
ncbi:1-deoxy-D-xylulose 5-phosphate reductoisomerase [Porphyromonas crevioricanis]|uniref:1-deoxy-D-xylulose 5-phosphate reductoisomerase n=2 Tax=Porphyromonas crevioricanis TaxID=393921 RepID=A0A0A2FLF9_9PORP|nr:1-deoxy-D-xylulose-5-phosphate reductoisomerase [Porphyromonas crevioricanis]KGN90972.1 1-deoxy-D-xylulose 5-phosphate reductoisomerase [Porphyromonas crevioricanis]KGN95068.1 1-deoxy-D-xylulose 5-phosphate reductoisomerase [Porphyromonas crevioricanis]SJZ54862.1 1-deoxy-D-xylulose 5-phosphate reductoisomerase [Porphyromonas crevioricanis]SQH73301.1 1-deoxy-D-xylulose 5-phosphate reductoisomerase [Porphyromonas crevioricanis]GAD06289.1 1-deoxy-D-xylulose 5-phosphate reductoisomerase [Porphy